MSSVIVGFIIAVTFIIISLVVAAKRQNETNAKFEGSNFISDIKYISDDGTSGLAIDEKRKLVCLINSDNKQILNYSDIISSEIIENGESITKTSRTSQIGNAIVGGVLLGGLGAVVGGLSGKKMIREKINKIYLNIIVNNVTFPIFNIVFLNCETKKGDFLYNSAIEKARHWHGVMESVIRQADSVFNKAQTNRLNSQSGNNSVADELNKLANLVEKGLISQNEFEAQKQKILSKS